MQQLHGWCAAATVLYALTLKGVDASCENRTSINYAQATFPAATAVAISVAVAAAETAERDAVYQK